MKYGNWSRRTLHFVGDPHGIEDTRAVNNDLGYFLAGWVIGRLPDRRWDSGKYYKSGTRLMVETTYDWSGH
jgi:hypothetical protein